MDKAYFAGGCFWGVENCFSGLQGVEKTRVGFMGGKKEKPSYEDVCSGKTGHAETLEVLFDPSKVDFKTLAMLFFEIHDPTQLDRQGPDVGTQYRSAVFFTDDEQRRVVEELIKTLREKGLKVVTKVVKAGKFWEAEEHHQKYYEKKGGKPYCHVRRQLF